MAIGFDAFLSTLPPEVVAEAKAQTARTPVPGKVVKVLMKTGKMRMGEVVEYAEFIGNISKLHYWYVDVKGLKKTQIVREDKIFAAE